MSLYAAHERTLRAGGVGQEWGGVTTGKYGCPASWTGWGVSHWTSRSVQEEGGITM